MKKTFVLPKDEYSKVYSEINSKYKSNYEGIFLCIHDTHTIDGKHVVYYFENFGYNNYNIYSRIESN